MQIDRVQADALLTTTRAVRRRMDFDRPVKRSVLEDCVRVALQAPVGSPIWKQHFVVITDPQMRMRIADLYRKKCYPYLDERDAEVAAMADDDPKKAMNGKNLSLAGRPIPSTNVPSSSSRRWKVA